MKRLMVTTPCSASKMAPCHSRNTTPFSGTARRSPVAVSWGVLSPSQAKVAIAAPSGYHEHRNLEKLVSFVNDSNMFIAAVVGGVKGGLETLGYRAEERILERADFEHLEAQGQLQTPA